MMNDCVNIKFKEVLCLICILIILMVMYVYEFSALKQGYHSDEVYNYGFANSYDTKDFMFDHDTPVVNVWRSSEVLKNYLCVETENRFSFSAAYRNTISDYNPPLYCYLVHMVSSLFPNTFSWWFSFIINLFCILGILLFIFFIVREIFDDYYIAISAVILFGFSVGCMNIVLFLRMYALGAFFACAFLYCSILIYKNNNSYSNYIIYFVVFFICFCGAYTLHLFLVFAFPVVVCFVVYYFLSKNYKTFFSYGLTCLCSVLLSFAIYPSVVNNVGGSNDSHTYAFSKYPTSMQFRLYSYDLTRDLFGIHVFPYSNVYLVYFLIFLAVFVFFLIPFIFVFRKEVWLKSAIIYLKNNVCSIIKNKNLYVLIPIISSVIFTIFIASERTSMYLMTVCANRYLFVVYPLASILFVCVIYMMSSILITNKKVVSMIVLLLCLLLSLSTHLFENHDTYLFKHDESGITFDDIESDANEIIVVLTDWYITSLAPELYDTNSFYTTNCESFRNDSLFEDVDIDKPMYLIVDKSFLVKEDFSASDIDNLQLDDKWKEHYLKFCNENDLIEFYENFDIVNSVQFVGTDSVSFRNYNIYKVIFE